MDIQKKIYLVGNFGYYKNNFNGQTIRSRTVLESIRKYKPECFIFHTDTSVIKNNKRISLIKIFLLGIYHCISSHHVILLPAQSAVKFMLIFTYYIKSARHKKIHYIAIGGWLNQFLANNPKYIKYVKEIDYIYVQTQSLRSELEKRGLKNIVHFPNYRLYQNGTLENRLITKDRRLVFFSRVAKEKGIELAIEAINSINNKTDNRLTLHIYGPIKNEYKWKIDSLLIGSDSIFYKGVLEPDQIKKVLAQYDLMLFPTYYEGEGFPGAILDSISAGVPVIASDWKYNAEIITNGYTGLICKNKNVSDLAEKIRYLTGNVSLLKTMKKNCLEEAKMYHEAKIAPILIGKIS